MKNRNPLMSLALIGASLAGALTHQALAGPGGGSGVRGGGQIIEVNGAPELLDLAERAACDSRTGAELLETMAELRNALAKVAQLDWYFAFELEREIRFLDYCFTGPLWPVPLRDWPVKPPAGRREQVAFRLYSAVYIDEALYLKLSPRSRAFLILHEVLHSYLDMDLPMRDLRLRSMVKALDQVERGQIFDRQTLHKRMHLNGVEFPTSVAKLDRYRTQLEFLLAPVDVRRERLARAADPESYLQVDFSQLAESLADWDRLEAHWKTPLRLMEEGAESLLLQGTLEQMRALLDRPFKTFNPAVVALSVFYQLDDSKRAIVLGSRGLSETFRRAYQNLSDADVQVAAMRILANPALQTLSCSEPKAEFTPVTALVPRSNDCRNAPLPYSIKAFATAIALFMEAGRWDQIEQEMTGNPKYYSSFGLHSLQERIRTMTVPIVRERPLAIAAVKKIAAGVQDEVLSRIAAKSSPEDYARLLRMIRPEQF